MEDEGKVVIPYTYKPMKAGRVPEVLTGKGGAGLLPSL